MCQRLEEPAVNPLLLAVNLSVCVDHATVRTRFELRGDAGWKCKHAGEIVEVKVHLEPFAARVVEVDHGVGIADAVFIQQENCGRLFTHREFTPSVCHASGRSNAAGAFHL